MACRATAHLHQLIMSKISLKQVRENKYLTFVIGKPEEGRTVEPFIRDVAPEDFVGELYHPGKEDPQAYRPGNELASEYTALRVLWTNFATLNQKAKQESDSFSRKLTLKSAVVELRSFIDALPRLGTLIAKVPAHDGQLPRTFVCLTQGEREGFEKKSKALNKAKNQLFTTLTKVRNGVGAHMSQPRLRGFASVKPKEEASWQELEDLWQLLEPRMFLGIGEAAESFLSCVQHLPVFEFYRFETPKRIRVHVPAIAQENGLELRFNALSSSLIKQIEEVDASCVEGTCIVLRRDPVRLRVRWPEDLLKSHPGLGDTIVEI